MEAGQVLQEQRESAEKHVRMAGDQLDQFGLTAGAGLLEQMVEMSFHGSLANPAGRPRWVAADA
jgi:hypothetical protein